MTTILDLLEQAEARCRAMLDTVDGAFAELGGNADPANLVERLEQALCAALSPIDLATSQLDALEALAHRDSTDLRSVELLASGRIAELRDAVASAASWRDLQHRVLGVAVASQMTRRYERLHDETSAARWRATAASRTAAYRATRDEHRRQWKHHRPRAAAA